MRYDLKDETDVTKFKARVNHLIEKGKVVTLTESASPKKLTEEESIRRKQMNLVHMWFSAFADFCGEIDKEKVKTDVKRALLGMKMGYNRFSKRNEPTDYHLSEMTVSEASDFMSKFKIWAQQEFGCYLPYENEIGYDEMARQYRNR